MVLMKKINHPAFKTNTIIGVQGVATISVNSNMRSTGAATLSINPARHTSMANASGRGGNNRYVVGKIQQ